MSQRKLASVQTIDRIEPIEVADNIVKGRVMGWDVVVKKGEFSPGDPCIFFEVDSVLPEGAPWAEFMRPRKFRVKTAKLRGVLSQGLAIPASILPGPLPPVGTDVSEALGVTKYEAVLPDAKEIAGGFPAGVPKTDEIRLQSALGVLDEIKGLDFYVTTKIDGTSATFFQSPGGLVVCSRNFALRRGDNHAWRIAERHDFTEKLPPGFAVQGELTGPGIQKNRLGLWEVALFVFNVWDFSNRRYLPLDEMEAFAKERGLTTVPIEEVVRGAAATAFEHTLDTWIERAKGLYAGSKNRKEGIVVRPTINRNSPTLEGARLSFKVMNNDFLLKDEE